MILKLTWQEFCAAAIEKITEKSAYVELGALEFRESNGSLASFDRPAFVELTVLDDEP